MQTAAAEKEPVTAPPPPKTAPPTRLKPEYQRRLREAKFDLQARYRSEMTENNVLEQFFEEAFETWLKAKLGEKKASK